MPLENRNLEPGTVLSARYKKKERTCEVVQTDDGLRYKLDDGSEHKSPSSAGKATMGGVACNGWRFWSIQGTGPAPRANKPKAAKEPKTKAPAKAKKGAKAKSKKAKGAAKPKGKAMRARATDVPSYGCGACGATFGSQKAAVNHALGHTS
ncbi:MAG: hypothetical protein M3P30_03075 [Chloroflexota bacterium]|nr:hypothetical protein [Chloroflexota bacterium]